MYKLKYKREFAGAHHLPGYDGDCSRNHGHNWIAEFICESETLNEQGMVADFAVFKAVAPDHIDLNEWMSAPTTTENVARELFERLAAQGVPIVKVKVSENKRGSVTYKGDIRRGISAPEWQIHGLLYKTLQKLLAAGFGEHALPLLEAVGNATAAVGKPNNVWRVLAIFADAHASGVLRDERVREIRELGIDLSPALQQARPRRVGERDWQKDHLFPTIIAFLNVQNSERLSERLVELAKATSPQQEQT